MMSLSSSIEPTLILIQKRLDFVVDPPPVAVSKGGRSWRVQLRALLSSDRVQPGPIDVVSLDCVSLPE